ncbi:MAG: hypothetical protein CL912_20265 [Deltaproteobacteria bacterium]|nr:hypothetical protein [Deltaproteobacteria bacterium]
MRGTCTWLKAGWACRFCLAVGCRPAGWTVEWLGLCSVLGKQRSKLAGNCSGSFSAHENKTWKFVKNT